MGPVFLSLIESSLSHGSKMAIALAAGVLVSDLLLICLSHLFSNWILKVLPEMTFIKVLAAVFFISFGIIKIFRKQTPERDQLVQTHPMGYLQHFTKGFVVNGFNPALLIFWTTMASLYQNKGGTASIMFFSGVLLTTFSMDILKSIFSNRISHYLSGKSIHRIVKVSGVVFIVFGVVLLIESMGMPVKEWVGI